MSDPETSKKVEETETGYRLTVKSKRGTGTRDEDTVTLTAKTETYDELRQDAPKMNGLVSQMMDNRRAHQPDGDDS